jgi:hypothetical protein
MVRALVLAREDVSPVGSLPRGSSRWFTLFALLAAFYLVVVLSIPGAFLIAKQASVVSSSQPIVPEERSSSEQLAGNPGEEGEDQPWHGPKRLRGVLPPHRVSIDKIDNLLSVPLAASTTLLEHVEFNKPVVTDEVRLQQDDAFPQELLGRSPPSSR